MTRARVHRASRRAAVDAPRRAARCSRPPPAAARPACSSSASCARSARTASRPRGSSRSRSPSAPPASCARACARACSSSATREAARETEAAFVCTFHGFCARLLRSPRARSPGSTAGFAMLDEALAASAARARPSTSRALRRLVRRRHERGATDGAELRAPALPACDRAAWRWSSGAHARAAQPTAQRRADGSPRRRPAALGATPAPPRAARRPTPRRGARSAGARVALRCCSTCCCARFGAALRARSSARAARSTSTTSSCVARRAAREPRGGARALVGALRAADGRRVPGHQRAPARAPRGARARQPVHGRRRAAVDLRLPPRRRRASSARAARSSRAAARPAPARATSASRRRCSTRSTRSSRSASARLSPLCVAGLREARTPSAGAEPAGRAAADRHAAAGRPTRSSPRSPELPPAPLWRQAEARLLARRDRRADRGGRARAGDVVVLLRAGGDIGVYERALATSGLRTLAAGGGFWSHQQVADLVAYLRALANPLDEPALYGVLASPLVRLLGDAWRCSRAPRASAARRLGAGASRPSAEAELLARLARADRAALARVRALARAASARARRARTLADADRRGVADSGYACTCWRCTARAAARQRPQAGAARARLRGPRGPRPARASSLTLGAGGASARRARPRRRRGGRARRGAADDDPRRQGPRVPGRVPRRPRRTPNPRAPDLLVDGERVGLRLVAPTASGSTPTLDYAALRDERRAARGRGGGADRLRRDDARARAADPERRGELRELARARPARRAISWLGAGARRPSRAAGERAAGGRRAVARDGARAPRAAERARAAAVDGVASAGAAMPAPARGAAAGARACRTSAGRRRIDRSCARRAAAPARAPPRRRGDAAPRRSATRALAEHERCGYRYYLQRVLGLPEDRRAARGGVARARGARARHARPRAAGAARLRAPARRRRRATWRRRARARAARRRRMTARARARCSRGGAQPRSARARGRRRGGVRREQPFAFLGARAAAAQRRPRPARRASADGTLLIVDYKSDRVDEGEDLAARVERDYAHPARGLRARRARRRAPRGRGRALVPATVPRSGRRALRGRASARELEALLAARIAPLRDAAFARQREPARGRCATLPGRAGCAPGARPRRCASSRGPRGEFSSGLQR